MLDRRHDTACAPVPRAARIAVVLWVVAGTMISAYFVLRGAWPVAVAQLIVTSALYAAFAATRR